MCASSGLLGRAESKRLAFGDKKCRRRYNLSDNLPLVAIYNAVMTVYIEYAFLDNFTMDCLLLFCACVTLKLPFGFGRIALGALTGTAIALLSVYLSGWAAFVVKAACPLLMCFVTVGKGKKLFWHILLTLAYTFVTGGAIVALFNLTAVDYSCSYALFYDAPLPLFVYFSGVLAAVVLCYMIHAYVKQSKQRAQYVKKVQITLDRRYSVTAFCDSGNNVTADGLPVCFVTADFGAKEYFARQLLRGTRQVQVKTLAGSKSVPAVKGALRVDGKDFAVYVALPAEKCNTPFQLLLPSQFCGGINESAGTAEKTAGQA